MTVLVEFLSGEMNAMLEWFELGFKRKGGGRCTVWSPLEYKHKNHFQIDRTSCTTNNFTNWLTYISLSMHSLGSFAFLKSIFAVMDSSEWTILT